MSLNGDCTVPAKNWWGISSHNPICSGVPALPQNEIELNLKALVRLLFYIRCGRVVTDFHPYPKFRKGLLS